jgi:hypothetical protein
MNEDMGTEQFESNRQWSGRRETLYDPAPSWQRRLSGFLITVAVAFGAGVALEDQMTDSQKARERAEFAARVRACGAHVPVAQEDGRIECRALMPRVEYLDRALTPTPGELRKILMKSYKGELRDRSD